MSDLLRASTELMQRTRTLATLNDEELRRFAVEAARDRDVEALWTLTEAHLILHGSSGSNVSKHTLESYRRYTKAFVEAWQGETLLRPSRNAGVLWVRDLETQYKPATVRVKIAAAKALYAALRWAGATDLSPFADVKPAKARGVYRYRGGLADSLRGRGEPGYCLARGSFRAARIRDDSAKVERHRSK